ncbi:unnamed protein product, partial [Rotaria sp. Silwood2]
MIKHQKTCQTSNKNSQTECFNIKEYFRPKTPQSIPRQMKEKITKAAGELISGVGFINFSLTAIDVGQNLSNKKNANIVNLLPHPTTV